MTKLTLLQIQDLPRIPGCFRASEVIRYLDNLNKARDKPS
jgi:hypothetical protein